MLECVEGLYIVSKQETERGGTASAIPGKEIAGFANTMIRDQGVCAEVIEEIKKRTSNVITSQIVVSNGVSYDLFKLDNWQADWKKILKGLA